MQVSPLFSLTHQEVKSSTKEDSRTGGSCWAAAAGKDTIFSSGQISLVGQPADLWDEASSIATMVVDGRPDNVGPVPVGGWACHLQQRRVHPDGDGICTMSTDPHDRAKVEKSTPPRHTKCI